MSIVDTIRQMLIDFNQTAKKVGERKKNWRRCQKYIYIYIVTYFTV